MLKSDIFEGSCPAVVVRHDPQRTIFLLVDSAGESRSVLCTMIHLKHYRTKLNIVSGRSKIRLTELLSLRGKE